AQLPVEEQIAVLGIIERAGTRKETELMLRCLESDNADLLTAAIDALSVVNPEALHPLLPQLIKHRFDEVKVAAIKVFALFDKKQAISLVEQMLHSIRPVQRRNAIFCLAHFDYASVSQILLTALKNEGDEENQQQIFSILLSNADEETFFQVYVEARSGRSNRAELYARLYAGLVAKIIAADSAKTEAGLFDAAEERLEKEKRSQNQRSAYQLEKIQKIRQESQKKSEPDPGLIRFAVVAYAIGAVLTALIWFLFMAPPSQPQKVARSAAKSSGQPKSMIKTVKGVVSGIDVAKRQVDIADSAEQKTYRVHFPEKAGALPIIGNGFHGQLKVTGERGGILIGELLNAF
ncbi:MAG TPA: HEAT repeat domain-containing protein, partial [Candidatus Rifleibacterium sp.]|nr:HEAT repeat domain-containing protein [Candidatus Rifleibacterium sp.]